VARVNDCDPTPPPTSTTSEPSGRFSQEYPVGPIQSELGDRQVYKNAAWHDPNLRGWRCGKKTCSSGRSCQLRIEPVVVCSPGARASSKPTVEVERFSQSGLAWIVGMSEFRIEDALRQITGALEANVQATETSGSGCSFSLLAIFGRIPLARLLRLSLTAAPAVNPTSHSIISSYLPSRPTGYSHLQLAAIGIGGSVQSLGPVPEGPRRGLTPNIHRFNSCTNVSPPPKLGTSILTHARSQSPRDYPSHVAWNASPVVAWRHALNSNQTSP
jgi:hypothetical protein